MKTEKKNIHDIVKLLNETATQEYKPKKKRLDINESNL